MKPTLRCLILLAAALPAAAIVPLAGLVSTLDDGLDPLKASSAGRRKGMAWNGAANETLVAWSRAVVGGDNPLRTRVRRLAADGSPLSDAIDLPGERNQIDPQVAWSPAAGRYLVVYEEDDASIIGEARVVRGQRLAADGTPVGPAIGIGSAVKHSLRPHVSWGGGRWFVVWVEAAVETGLTAGATLWGRFIAADGTPGLQVQIGSGLLSTSPRVAFNVATGRHLVVALTAAGASAWTVEDATGSVSLSFAMSTPGDVYYPDVAADPTPGSPRFLATWTEFDFGTDFDGDGASDIAIRVRGRFVNAATGEAGATIKPVETINAKPEDPLMEIQNSLAWSDGGYALHYQYFPQGSVGVRDLRLLRFGADGAALGNPEVLASSDGCIPECSIAGGGPGRYVCCFRTAGGRELSSQAWPAALPPPPVEIPPGQAPEAGGGGGSCAAQGGAGPGLAVLLVAAILSESRRRSA